MFSKFTKYLLTLAANEYQAGVTPSLSFLQATGRHAGCQL